MERVYLGRLAGSLGRVLAQRTYPIAGSDSPPAGPRPVESTRSLQYSSELGAAEWTSCSQASSDTWAAPFLLAALPPFIGSRTLFVL